MSAATAPAEVIGDLPAAQAWRRVLTLHLGIPPKTSDFAQSGSGWQGKASYMAKARKAVAGAYKAAAAALGVTVLDLPCQPEGERWRLKIEWRSPRPPLDKTDNAMYSLKPYVDACQQKVVREKSQKGVAPTPVDGEAPILIDDSDQHLVRDLDLQKSTKAEARLTFIFFAPEASGVEPPAEDERSDAVKLQELAQQGEPYGFTQEQAQERIDCSKEFTAALLEDLVTYGVLVFDDGDQLWRARAGVDAAAAERRDEVWSALRERIDSPAAEQDDLTYAQELKLAAKGEQLDRELARIRLADWLHGHPAWDVIELGRDLIERATPERIIAEDHEAKEDRDLMDELLTAVGLFDPEAGAPERLATLASYVEGQSWPDEGTVTFEGDLQAGVEKMVARIEVKPILPKWMKAGEQRTFEDGPLPCCVLHLKAHAAIEGYQRTLVLARHDKQGGVELALLPLDPTTIEPIDDEVLGHRRGIDDMQSFELYDTLQPADKEQALAHWRRWMDGNRLMAKTTNDRLAAIEAQGPQLERVLTARKKHESLKKATKAAKEDLELEQERMEELVGEACADSSWPQEVV